MYLARFRASWGTLEQLPHATHPLQCASYGGSAVLWVSNGLRGYMDGWADMSCSLQLGRIRSTLGRAVIPAPEGL